MTGRGLKILLLLLLTLQSFTVAADDCASHTAHGEAIYVTERAEMDPHDAENPADHICTANCHHTCHHICFHVLTSRDHAEIAATAARHFSPPQFVFVSRPTAPLFRPPIA